MESLKKQIWAVHNTLNTVEVQGIENMRKMVLCYDTLEYILENLGMSAKYAEGTAKEVRQDG